MSHDGSGKVVAAWNIAAERVHFVVHLPSPNPSLDLAEYELPGSEVAGPWRVVDVTANGHEVHMRIYRKRALVSMAIPAQSSADLDSAIRFVVGDDVRSVVQTALTRLVPIPVSKDIRMVPLLVCGLSSGAAEPWESSGATSFHLRLYDSVARSQGFVRVSRHVVVAAGLSGRLHQEIVNLIYEKMLYAERIGSSEVFSLLDGLTRYTLPTETSLFLQSEFARLGVLLAAIQVIVGVASIAAGDPGAVILSGAVASIVVLSALAYFLARKLRLVRWD